MLYPRIKAVIEKETGILVAGYVPELDFWQVGSRHLGLVLPGEIENLQGQIRQLGDCLEKTLDVDKLFSLGAVSYTHLLDKIKERYNEIIDGLDLNLNLDHEFDKIEENFLAKAGRDYAASRGEYLNGIVMANYLGYEFIDAAEVIFFDDNGNFEADITDKELSERLEQCLLYTSRCV